MEGVKSAEIFDGLVAGLSTSDLVACWSGIPKGLGLAGVESQLAPELSLPIVASLRLADDSERD